jgi:succinoglycan biosynthesis transport protein ExoP
LRGDIATLQIRRPVKVLAITSALPKEGKTSVAASLARSMVASGLHVLLIDGDLRRSSVGAALNVRCGSRGIVSVLKRECRLSEAITKDPRTALDILMVDKSDNSPQDLLGGSAFKALLEEARATYDFVVVDTPPQGAVSDVLLMAEFVDATLLAVRWNATPPTVVRWTLEAFGTRGLMPQGIFLNGVDYPSLTKKDPDVRTAYRSTRSYYPS